MKNINYLTTEQFHDKWLPHLEAIEELDDQKYAAFEEAVIDIAVGVVEEALADLEFQALDEALDRLINSQRGSLGDIPPVLVAEAVTSIVGVWSDEGILGKAIRQAIDEAR